MAIYTGIDGSAKSVSKIYTGVGGTARPVHKGYIGVDGVAKKFYDGGNPISSFALGTEFGISDPSGNKTYWYKLIHKGVPGGGLYDSTANGAWLWRTNIAASTSISNNYIYGYEGWALDNWCVNYPGGNITSSVANRLMTVHLPYVKQADYGSANVSSGSNGLSRKCFLLSAVEMGVYTWQGVDGLMAQEGAKLDYFDYTTAPLTSEKQIKNTGHAPSEPTTATICTRFMRTEVYAMQATERTRTACAPASSAAEHAGDNV